MATYNYGTLNTGNADVDALLFDVNIKWGGQGPGNGATITYSFPSAGAYWNSSYSPDNEPNAFTPVTEIQKATFRAALQQWANVANLNFVEVTESGASVGDVRLGVYDGMVGTGADAWAYYPANYSCAGDVWLSPSLAWGSADVAPGGWSYHVAIHELGHALGLSHPNDNGLAPGFDQSETVMSYYKPPFTTGYDQSPMLLDIAAIQALYGANNNYHVGNDTYGFDPSDGKTSLTIWDAGGQDTLSAAGFTLGCTLNLNAGSFSSFHFNNPQGACDGTNNVAIAYNVTLENAIGGSGADSIVGNSGNNVLDGGAGNDTLTGGGGDDTYYVDSVGDVVVENAASGNDLVYSAVDYVLAATLERLTLTGSALSGVGNSENNVMVGNGASNTLRGGQGNDELRGSLGNDTIYGGAGNDSVYGGADNDLLYGLSEDDLLYGVTGNDTLDGGTGNDTLDGGAGNDALLGGLGNDLYYVDSVADLITELSGEGADSVLASVDWTLGANVENLTLNGAALNGTGSADNNTLTGNELANTLRGAQGNDSLYGGNGQDTLFGGAGNDQLSGQNDNDVLYGVTGNDTLTGGAGADIFAFTAALAADNVDTITDFVVAEDKIWLDNAIYTRLTAEGGLGNAFFVGSATGLAQDADDYLLYNNTTGVLSYDADGNGAGAAVQFATLTTGLSLTASDFVVI